MSEKPTSHATEAATFVAVVALSSPILGALFGFGWRAFRMTAGW